MVRDSNAVESSSEIPAEMRRRTSLRVIFAGNSPMLPGADTNPPRTSYLA
jgi:hypothetical protein